MKYIKVFLGLFFIAYQPLLQSSCSFNQILGSPFSVTGSNPQGVAYTPALSTGKVFAAIVDSNDNNVRMYDINTTTGVPTQIGLPTPTGTTPQNVAFSLVPSGNLFLAVNNFGSNNISVFQVNTATGTLSGVVGSPFAAGNGPSDIAFSPVMSGKLFAAVTNQIDDTVSIYQVNTTTGVFSGVVGSAFALPLAAATPLSVAFSSDISGNLFMLIGSVASISIYQINITTGAPTIVGAPIAVNRATDVAYSTLVGGNLFAMATAADDNSVHVYNVNTSTGAFTEIVGSPYAAGTFPTTVAFSSVIGNTMYAAIGNTAVANNLYIYSVNLVTGAFTAVTGSPFSIAASSTFGVAFSPQLIGGLFLARTNSSLNSVSILQLPPALLVGITSPSVIIKLGDSTTITAVIFGGIGPYTVTWQDAFVQVVPGPIVSRTVSPLVSTTYFISSVVDDLGCIGGPSNAIVVRVRVCI